MDGTSVVGLRVLNGLCLGVIIGALFWGISGFLHLSLWFSGLALQRSVFRDLSTHRLLGSSFWGFPDRILNINQKKELLWSLWIIRGFGLRVV